MRYGGERKYGLGAKQTHSEWPFTAASGAVPTLGMEPAMAITHTCTCTHTCAHTRMHMHTHACTCEYVFECVKRTPHLSHMQNILRISILFFLFLKFWEQWSLHLLTCLPRSLPTLASPSQPRVLFTPSWVVVPLVWSFNSPLFSVFGSSSQAVSCILISRIVWDLTRGKGQLEGSLARQR